MSTAEQVEQLLAAKQGAEGALERLRTERYREQQALRQDAYDTIERGLVQKYDPRIAAAHDAVVAAKDAYYAAAEQQVCDSCLSDPCRCVGLPPLEPR